MAKLTDTTIYGDLTVKGKIKSNGDNVMLDTHFKGSTGVSYYVPVVIWHGRLEMQPTPSFIAYHSAGCTISITYVSTGTYTITMSGVNGANVSSTNYQVIAIGVGTNTNTTTTPSYITCPSSYKNTSNFRLLLSDDSALNDGYAEISIIKFITIS